MTDLEILELAAKAAGIDVVEWNDGREPYSSGECFVLKSNATWNPLNDDGDALRLAVKLHMTGIDCYFWHDVEKQSSASAGRGEVTWGGVRVYEPANYTDTSREQDPYAATRRAIVRVAAEMGRNIS